MGFFFFFSAFNIGQFEMVFFDFEDEDDVAFSVQVMGHPPPAQSGRSRPRGHLPGKGTVTFCPSGALCSLEAHSDPFPHSFVLQASKKLREEPDQPPVTQETGSRDSAQVGSGGVKNTFYHLLLTCT